MQIDPSSPIVDGSSQKTSGDQPPKPKKKRKRYRSRTARLTLGLMQLAGFSYAIVLLSLMLMESRLVYPGAFMEVTRASGTNGDVESVQYDSTEGVSLQGRLLERNADADIVLFFHGNGEKAKWLDDWMYGLSEAFNATVMVAEYRGFEDEVVPTEKGVLADCFAARDYLCARFGKSPTDIILYGRSLGGGCAVAVASQGGAKALVLERTFDRLVNVAAEKYPVVPVRWLMKNRYDSIAKLTVYDGPLVVLHGTADTIIPMPHAERLYNSSGCEQKRWIAVPGLGHNDALPTDSLQEIVAAVREFTSPSESL